MASVRLQSLLFLVVVGFAAAFDDAPTLDPHIPTVKPQTATTSDSCVGQCAMIFVDEMNAQLGPGKSVGLLNLNYNEFLTAFSNVTFFEKFCNIYHEFQHCYSSCEHGYLLELLSRSSAIVDEFCVYNFRAIKEKFGCLAQLDKELSQQCLRTCTSHHNAVTSLMQNFKHLALNGDSTQAEKYLGESCEYVICTMHCDVPAIAHLCGFPTANLVIDLTKKSFNAMQTMALDTGAVAKWPSVCADIKTYALPQAPSNPPAGNAVIAQSPHVPPQENRSDRRAEKVALVFFGSSVLIFFGILLR
ncbi:Protein C50F4.8 [Aphelenchoides fujianensis]|nr:Protein C50F4.8 [Aphelenchoides fujianensis]